MPRGSRCRPCACRCQGNGRVLTRPPPLGLPTHGLRHALCSACNSPIRVCVCARAFPRILGSSRALRLSFASVPQKDALGQRSDDEKGIFGRSLGVMTNCYASICATAVIQLKDVPPRPAEYDGVVIVEGLAEWRGAAGVEAELSRLGLDGVQVHAMTAGRATVRFASHELAVSGARELQRAGHVAFCAYNETCYDRACGTPYSGWCTAEQGSASMVVAHLGSSAVGKAERRLPEPLARAQASRPKLTDISGGEVRAVTTAEEPAQLLQRTIEDVEHAHFVGKADGKVVHQMLCEFEWTMKVAVEQATLDVAGTGLTVDPQVARQVRGVRPVDVVVDVRRASSVRSGASFCGDGKDGGSRGGGGSRGAEGPGVELLPRAPASA